MIIRPVAAADIAAVTDIYGHHVLHGFGTFEEVPPTVEAMARRHADVMAQHLPYLGVEIGGQLAGYAYASVFRPRIGYRYTAEDSVYIHPDHQGRGLGKALLGEVIAACEARGLRQLVAVIGDSRNAGSIALHAALGFEHSGVGKAVGFKHGRWVDTVSMQRDLNGGDATAPDGRGLDL